MPRLKAIDLENLIYDKEKNLGVNIKHQMDISDVEQDIDGIIKSITITSKSIAICLVVS